MRGESVMTFKAPARGGRSFLERLEVARPAPEGRFDLHAFDETTRAMIEDATGGLDLVERYSTVFKRRLLTLNMGRSEIEIALDAGHFLIGQVRAPLFEVEF
jgi:inorganic triphosphatase YgiF